MQTFLPFPSFLKSAQCLDYRRLGKQRVESRQILKIIATENPTGGWVNHPAVRMWRGYSEALKLYSNIVILEWIRRGYKNNMEILPVGVVVYPSWLGNSDFHASHRSNLLRKFPEHYAQFQWSEPDDLAYVWGENSDH